MGNVWFAVPSKRPFEEASQTLKLWQNQGYLVAIQRDASEPHSHVLDRGPWNAELVTWRDYRGYAEAVNSLVKMILDIDRTAEWIVTGGDDVQPDFSRNPADIAIEGRMHFYNPSLPAEGTPQPLRQQGSNLWTETFGVMQPTGDRWGESRNTHAFQKWPDHPYKCVHCGQPEGAPPHMHGAYIDRTCGSPWMGRSFCERINQGNGPLWPEYFHMGVDRELQEVATRLGILWQRPDLIHYHAHWGRKLEGKPGPTSASMPTFLAEANSLEQWNKYEAIFNARKAANFPGSEPL